MTKVKICGLTDVMEAMTAANAGADFIGLVFAPGSRKIETDRAREISMVIHGLKNPPEVVGVFVNQLPSEVNEIAVKCNLDRIQLSGDEDWGYCRKIEKPLIRAVHVNEAHDYYDIIEMIEIGRTELAGEDVIFLLDTRTGNAYGGTGKTFDWKLAETAAARFPVMIAGGLTTDNVERLIAEVHPWGVDVSSGVETGGHKDILKIRKFIKKAKGGG